MKSRRLTKGQVTQLFLVLEEKYNLIDWQISDVFVWQSIRVKLAEKLIYMPKIHSYSSSNISIVKLIKKVYRRGILNSIIYNPFFDFSHSDTLVFESDRRYLANNMFIDIYTKYLCDDLEEENITFTKYQINFSHRLISQKKNKTKHLDFILGATKVISLFITAKINNKDFDKIKKVEDEIFLFSGKNINVFDLFIKEIKRYKSQYPLYNKLFRKKKPNRLFLINSCDKAPLIKAAKDNRITVIELQHGLMSNESVIQHYPNTTEDSLEYFPDKFYLWENMKMNSSKLPLSKSNILFFENKHLTYIKNLHRDVVRKENQILIISQPIISMDIYQFIVRNLNAMNDFEFVFKTHPTEDKSLWKDKYNLKFSNFRFANNEDSLYKLMSESKYVIGVSSAALFEAHYMGCEVLLLKLDGVKSIAPFFINEKVRIIEIERKLLNYI